MFIVLLLNFLWRMVRYAMVGTALVGVNHAIGDAAAIVVDVGDAIG